MSRRSADPRRRRLADPRPRQRPTTAATRCRLPLPPHRHRRPHPAGLLRDPRRRASQTAVAFWARAARLVRPATASAANACSPTTAPATGQALARRLRGTGHAPSRRPDLAAHRPTARSNGSTASCSRNGPTSDPGRSERRTHRRLHGFIHFYNHHRAHGALGWSTPAATLTTSQGQPPRRSQLDDEVLGLGVGADDRRGGLLGFELELLGELHADAVELEQLGDLGLVLEVGARRVAPRVARRRGTAGGTARRASGRPRRRSPTPRGCGGASSSASASAISTPRPCSSR